MIIFAWDINEDMLTGAPKWLNSDHFDIIAKSVATGPNGPLVDLDDPDDLRQMIRTLLEERFKMVSHMEDRPVDAYTLMAVNPKLKKADPANHTLCKDGPGADGKDPRIANPILGRLISCQNMTMKQFGEQLQSIAPGYIKVPVLDATGLEGAWDFTLSFSRSNQLQGGGQSGETSTASDPSGAISLFDAIKKQLGLKLEKQKRPVPVLVIDHIDEKPTEN
jgi:uncharacterized protein (TIGR03435 family)